MSREQGRKRTSPEDLQDRPATRPYEGQAMTVISRNNIDNVTRDMGQMPNMVQSHCSNDTPSTGPTNLAATIAFTEQLDQQTSHMSQNPSLETSHGDSNRFPDRIVSPTRGGTGLPYLIGNKWTLEEISNSNGLVFMLQDGRYDRKKVISFMFLYMPVGKSRSYTVEGVQNWRRNHLEEQQNLRYPYERLEVWEQLQINKREPYGVFEPNNPKFQPRKPNPDNEYAYPRYFRSLLYQEQVENGTLNEPAPYADPDINRKLERLSIYKGFNVLHKEGKHSWSREGACQFVRANVGNPSKEIKRDTTVGLLAEYAKEHVLYNQAKIPLQTIIDWEKKQQDPYGDIRVSSENIYPRFADTPFYQELLRHEGGLTHRPLSEAFPSSYRDQQSPAFGGSQKDPLAISQLRALDKKFF